MNNKIPLQQLSDLVADKANVSPELAKDFIKEIFNEATLSLLKGDEVDLPGIGKFHITHSPESPIIFTPDQQLAEELNAPFSIFQPVEINEGVDVKELSNLNVNDISSENSKATAPEYEEENAEVVSESKTEEELIEDCNTIVDVEVDKTDIAILAVEDINENLVQNEPEPQLENITVDEVDEVDKIENSDPAEPTSISVDNENKDINSTENITYIPEQEEECIEYHRPKTRFGLGFFLGLLTGLVIASIALAVYVIYLQKL